MKNKLIGVLALLSILCITGFLKAAGPDIEVSRISVIGKRVGNCNLLKINLKNVGTVAIAKPFRVIIYIYNNNRLIKDYRKTFSSNIRPGGGITFFQRDVYFPYSSSYKITVIADVDHVLRPDDRNEDNNFKEIRFNINQTATCADKPDLKTGKMSMRGRRVTVYVSSLNRVKSNKDIYVKLFYSNTSQTKRLNKKLDGRKFASPVYFDIPAAFCNGSTIMFHARVDPDRRITEIDENNNDKRASLRCN